MHTIEFTVKAAKEFGKLPKKVRDIIAKKLARLAESPAAAQEVKALKGSDAYRLRAGDYRVVYFLENDRLVIVVVRVAHRRDVYD